MSRLSTLRTQLSLLRQARWFVRLMVGLSAVAIVAILILVCVLILDLLFELPVLQRLVVLTFAAGFVALAGILLTWPMLQVRESVEDMALLVERHQKIDSDLIAALQFEQPAASEWGSRQLESAVIDYVAHVGSSLNVFDGFSRSQIIQRGVVLGAMVVLLLGAAILYPNYAGTFLNRLLLGRDHYPTATTIEQVVINGQTVLDNQDAIRLGRGGDSAPRSIKAAQGRPLEFAVVTVGKIPKYTAVRLVAMSRSRTRTRIELAVATREDRLNRLRRASEMLRKAADSDEVDTSAQWRAQVVQLLLADAGEIASRIEAVKQHAEFGPLADQVNGLLASKSPLQDHKVLLTGQLDRLLESVRYSLVIGDAWTESAQVSMIPLPAVEPLLRVVPPAYARQSAAPEPGQRQVEVLQGSAVELTIASTNGKELKSAWVNIRQRRRPQPPQNPQLPQTKEQAVKQLVDQLVEQAMPERFKSPPPPQESDEMTRYDLSRLPGDKNQPIRWGLVDQAGNTPLKQIREEFRYEIQVLDVDGLSLETPIRGAVRIKTDRPPSASADIVHKVVLPQAEPVVHYRATDDYGLSSIKLVTEIERHSEQKVQAAAPAESAQTGNSASSASAVERQEFPVHATKEPIGADQLPIDSTFTLSLSPLKLTKGDRLKITLEVVDYRGENDKGEPIGQRYQSDPLVLEISDESGVLAAISEADERSEQRLTDIIKRQLGIGESP